MPDSPGKYRKNKTKKKTNQQYQYAEIICVKTVIIVRVFPLVVVICCGNWLSTDLIDYQRSILRQSIFTDEGITNRTKEKCKKTSTNYDRAILEHN